jgi:Flp pilus assembly protein CpaB
MQVTVLGYVGTVMTAGTRYSDLVPLGVGTEHGVEIARGGTAVAIEVDGKVFDAVGDTVTPGDFVDVSRVVANSLGSVHRDDGD